MQNATLLPDAVRIDVEKELISVDFAQTLEHKKDDIQDSDIETIIRISFVPNDYLTTINLMTRAAYEYQKKFDIDLGISFEAQKDDDDAK